MSSGSSWREKERAEEEKDGCMIQKRIWVDVVAVVAVVPDGVMAVGSHLRVAILARAGGNRPFSRASLLFRFIPSFPLSSVFENKFPTSLPFVLCISTLLHFIELRNHGRYIIPAIHPSPSSSTQKKKPRSCIPRTSMNRNDPELYDIRRRQV